MAARTATYSGPVKGIMTTDPVRVGADTSARELARILNANEISGVPVVDAQDRLIGVVSKTNLLERCVEGPLGSRPGTFFESLAEGLDFDSDLNPEELGTVGEFMSSEPITSGPDEPVTAVAGRMGAEGVHRIIVIDGQRHVLGIVTSLDLLRALAR